MKINKKSVVLFSLMGTLAISSYAANAASSTSTDGTKTNDLKKEFSSQFVVTPINVTIEQPGKPLAINVSNRMKYPLYVQTKLFNYSQTYAGGQLKDVVTPISGNAAVLVTPVIIKDIPGERNQIIRVLAMKQDPQKEIVYRLLVKSLTPTDLKSTGALFTIAYSIPVFILPTNINEKFDVKYVKENGKSYLKLENTGNVHVTFRTISIKANGKSYPLNVLIPRVLAGNSELVAIPNNIVAGIEKNGVINAEVLINNLKDVDKKPTTKELNILTTV